MKLPHFLHDFFQKSLFIIHTVIKIPGKNRYKPGFPLKTNKLHLHPGNSFVQPVHLGTKIL